MRQARLIVTVVAALAVALGPAAGRGDAAPAKLTWNKCFADIGPFQCTTVQVPLDYDEPNGPSISIALTRLPATDQAHRIGSLFLNPGGPGGSGVDFVVFGGPFLFTDEVRARFDLIGFDPRGIVRSSALRCFGNPKQWEPFFTPFAFPTTPDEEQVWMDADAYLAGACAQRGGRIMEHMSTANVARDLDVMREAVGDAKLSYYGVSYGSFLGQTYANMFPDNFRALVIDGVLDPIAWVNTGGSIPFSTGLRSDEGAMATLEEFFRLCDAGGDTCAFAPDSAERFAAIADTLKQDGPVVVDLPDGPTELNYSSFIGLTLGPMYDSLSWEDFDEELASIEEQVLGAPELAARAGSFARAAWRPSYIAKRGFPRYPNFVENFPAVACADSDNPDDYAVWSAQAALAEQNFGYFGPLWTWITSICQPWPAADADRYTGPFDTETDAPVLVVGNTFDPATRYQGAVTTHGLLSNSSLLTVHGWGHTSLFLSACADEAIARYLIQVDTPAEGAVCEQDHVPFSSP